jgi:hypothetical protein
MGEFWPEDIDVSICDVIYYGFGTILNDTFDVCSWDPWFDMGPPDFGDTTIRNCIQVRIVKNCCTIPPTPPPPNISLNEIGDTGISYRDNTFNFNYAKKYLFKKCCWFKWIIV